MSRVEEASPSENNSPEKRKSMKPIMEKRRRARINESLNELKSLILEAMKKDTSCYTKLEKADILAMTVQHLKSVRQQQINSPRSSDPDAVANYRAGYNECAAEATRFLMNCQGLDPQARTRILSHLALCCQAVRAPPTETTTRQAPSISVATSTPYTPILPPLASTPAQYARPPVRSSQESNHSFGSLHYQIVPGTLPNGKLAAVLVPAETVTPTVTNPTFQPQVIPLYPGAGVAESSGEARQYQGLQVPSGATLRVAGSDPFWRPWP